MPQLDTIPGEGDSILDATVREFFEGYERANAESSLREIGALYADVFMFGGPQGVQCVKKEDFLRVLPKRKESFRSVGLVSSNVESLEVSKLDSKYVLAKVVWKMRFERGTGAPVDSQNSATYILTATADSFEIVFQLDHQDLAKKVQDLG